MKKTIQVNKAGFIITQIMAEDISRELRVKQNNITRVSDPFSKYSQGLQSETITISLDIELQSTGNTTEITTKQVIDSLIDKLMKDRETYP